jgi:hypothetical protein|tara:strand:- start:208 stop:660 length:453 start_codon:yes stop_codon:yes gene_type:complete
MEDKTNYEAYGLVDLLKLKKANLSSQSKLREESKLLDEAIAQCPEVFEVTKLLSNSGGSKRVQLKGLIPKDLRVQYKVTKSWDQDYLNDLSKELQNFPFTKQYVEDSRATKKLQDEDPKAWDYIEKGLTTKINERPYVTFIDPLKGVSDE